MVSDDLKAQFLINPRVTFLNHSSYGACPRPVFAEYQAWQQRLEEQPVAFMDPRHLALRFAEVREALAAEVGAEAEDLVAVVNATAGLNLVARSLPLAPGDEILTTDHEYAALDKTWAFVARRTGAVIRRVEIPLPLTSAEAFSEAVLAGITARTKVLFLSHITSPTALMFPIARVVAEARARGIRTVIDGAHTPGHIALNLAALGADFYVANCHKWLMAPKGSAFLHVRRDCHGLLAPALISHGWTADGASPGPFGHSAFQDAFQFQGTRDWAAWLAVPAAIAFRRDHGWDRVAARCRDLAQETAVRLAALSGLAALSTAEFCAPQMVSLPLPDCDPLALHDRLLAEFSIEVPVHRWNGRCFLRLSVQGYNTRAEVDRLLAVLSEVFGFA